MRVSVIIFAEFFALAGVTGAIFCLPSSADTIHLKNGRNIWADTVRERGTRIEYDIGEDTYAIPKSSVELVEAGGMPPELAVSSKGRDVPSFTPLENYDAQKPASAPVGIIENDSVNKDALAAVEKAGNDQTSAAAYYIAGKLLSFDSVETSISLSFTCSGCAMSCLCWS